MSSSGGGFSRNSPALYWDADNKCYRKVGPNIPRIEGENLFIESCKTSMIGHVATKREVLEGHDYLEKVPAFDPKICEELEAEGFLGEVSECLPGTRCWMLRYKGAQLLEFLRGERHSLYFRAPDWVLIEISKR